MCEQSVFQRYEMKYLLTAEQYVAVIDEIEGRTRADSHGKSAVCSLYFDTPDYLLIRRSLEKPDYKEKLRLRSYGVAEDGSDVYLEIKKKYNDIVYKRRVEMKYKDAVAYLSGKAAPEDSQIMREIDYFIGYYKNLRPSMLLSYNRSAYYADGEGLRITVDTDIKYRNYDLNLKSGVYGENALPEGAYALIEVKTGGAIPLWLARLFSENRVYKTSFSKYGSAYTKMTAENNNAEVYQNVG